MSHVKLGQHLLIQTLMKLFFCPFTVSVHKCDGSCNTTDDPYARVCVPNKVTNLNEKVFNLMSGVNKTRFLVIMNCVSVNKD